MKAKYSEQEKFITSLLIFIFVFIVLVITVLSLHYAKNKASNSDNQNTTVSTDSFETSASRSIETTASSSTESAGMSSSDSQSQISESTSVSTKYQAATVPTYIPPQTVSTQGTTASQTTAASSTTESTQTPADQPDKITAEDITDEKMAELITKKYLTVHPNSRPGYKLRSVDNIVVHYVANAGSTADQNWRNFNNNKPGTSAHFIIDLDGSILQCMPLDEVAWAIGTEEGNYTSISIECCHPDATGKFTDATYESLVKLVSWLCAEFNLTEENVKRHYDYPRTNSSGVVWHKQCPLYFVNNPKEWEAFKDALYIP